MLPYEFIFFSFFLNCFMILKLLKVNYKVTNITISIYTIYNLKYMSNCIGYCNDSLIFKILDTILKYAIKIGTISIYLI